MFIVKMNLYLTIVYIYIYKTCYFLDEYSVYNEYNLFRKPDFDNIIYYSEDNYPYIYPPHEFGVLKGIMIYIL